MCLFDCNVFFIVIHNDRKYLRYICEIIAKMEKIEKIESSIY